MVSVETSFKVAVKKSLASFFLQLTRAWHRNDTEAQTCNSLRAASTANLLWLDVVAAVGTHSHDRHGSWHGLWRWWMTGGASPLGVCTHGYAI